MTEINKFERHPISDHFGDLEAEEFQELKDRIESLGVLDPVILYESQVLDGWQRTRAATELGMEVTYKQFDGSYEDAVDYALAKHTRRSMTPAARIQVQLRLLNRTWARPGRPEKGFPGTQIQTTQDTANATGVSTTTVKRIKRIERQAISELKAEVARGRIEIKPAAQIAALPHDEQKSALEAALSARQTPRAAAKRKDRAKEPTVQVALVQATSELAELKAANCELQEKLNILIEENGRLTDRFSALVAGDAPTDEETREASAHIAELRSELQAMASRVKYVNDMDSYWLGEINELKRTCNAQRKALRKLLKESGSLVTAQVDDDWESRAAKIPYEPQEVGTAFALLGQPAPFTHHSIS